MLKPKATRSSLVVAQHFRWRLRRRSNTWYADGRTNSPSPGRHSLGTHDYGEAQRLVHELDAAMAVKFGIIERTLQQSSRPPALRIEVGIDLYLEHLGRPAVAGGACAKTRERYAPVFNKFTRFARGRGVTEWAQVNRGLVNDYLKYLSTKGYAQRTLYLEGTVIKQFVRWAIAEQLLSEENRVGVKLRKVENTTTYCWKATEVSAMLQHCRKEPTLQWLADLIQVLSRTGLRIGEAVNLRWADVDFEGGVLCVLNDPRQSAAIEQRTTKSRRNRYVRLHSDLVSTLKRRKRSGDAFVLCGPRGGKLKPDSVREAFVRDVLKPLESRFPSPPGALGFKDGRLHSFRHFFCSTCANEGTPERIVSAWLGHASGAMLRVYYHMRDDESRRWMEKVNFAGEDDQGDVAAESSPDGRKEGTREATAIS